MRCACWAPTVRVKQVRTESSRLTAAAGANVITGDPRATAVNNPRMRSARFISPQGQHTLQLRKRLFTWTERDKEEAAIPVGDLDHGQNHLIRHRDAQPSARGTAYPERSPLRIGRTTAVRRGQHRPAPSGARRPRRCNSPPVADTKTAVTVEYATANGYIRSPARICAADAHVEHFTVSGLIDGHFGGRVAQTAAVLTLLAGRSGRWTRLLL